MLSSDNSLETLIVAGFQPASGAQALRFESLDSALLVSALETSLDGFLLFNHELRCLFANRVACEILGRSPETIGGQPLLSFFAGDGQETRLLAQMGRWSTTIVRGDGQKREVECTQAVIEQGGNIQGVLMMRDVTSIRRATREAHILKQLTTSITYKNPLESILAMLARDVVQILGIQACFITLIN